MTNEFEMNAMATLRPTSAFIIRSCLGWLFDQLNLSNDYYLYRQNRKSLDMLLDTAATSTSNDMVAVRILVPKQMATFFNGNQQIHLNADYPQDNPYKLFVSLEKSGTNTQNFKPLLTDTSDKSGCDLTVFDPLLESVLSAACPFLADFRVSIMPKRNSKAVSRTGRYRHYTPRNFTSTTTATKEDPSNDDLQTKLAEAFLHSQSLSVRRTVEFVQERVFSAVVKDFHVDILVPFKRSIIASIDAIELRDSKAILEEICRIYENGEKMLYEKWQEFVPPAALERVKVRKKRGRIINCIRSV